jgi:maltoporin
MESPVGLPGFKGLKVTLIAGLALLTTDALFAQSTDQTDVSALKTQMNQMQKQYEQRIESMEAKMKTLESKAESGGSILNTHVLTDSDGKSMDGKATAPMLDDSFLKSLTRNFVFTAYLRAGFGFNGSGGSQSFNFEPPDNYGGRSRLGNENDTYMELSLQQNHILGDGPDVLDVSARFTLQYFNGSIDHGNQFDAGTDGAGAGIVEAYVLAKNVFKSEPEIGVWGGERFYDRWNIDSLDYFWLNESGVGFGVQDIPLGPGKLWIAWLGGNDNNSIYDYPTSGHLFKQTFDVRWKDIDIGFGKLTAVLIGNYIKGGTVRGGATTFTDLLGNSRSYSFSTNEDMWGIGGGLIWQYDFANKSYLRVAGLASFGASAGLGGSDLGTSVSGQEAAITGAFQQALNKDALRGNPIPANVSFHNPVNDMTTVKAIVEYIWNPAPNFSLGVFAVWENSNQGFQEFGNNGPGTKFKTVSGSQNMFSIGTRPVYWITDTIAIQGQANYTYEDNNRGYAGANSFGRSGSMGVFTIAPSIKPKGGYFTRPELRLFATFACWSDSLKGSTTPVGEGGNLSGAVGPYANGKANYGWIFGSQVEIWW